MKNLCMNNDAANEDYMFGSQLLEGNTISIFSWQGLNWNTCSKIRVFCVSLSFFFIISLPFMSWVQVPDVPLLSRLKNWGCIHLIPILNAL